MADSRNTGMGQARAKKCSELPAVASQLMERGLIPDISLRPYSKRIHFKPIGEKKLPST